MRYVLAVPSNGRPCLRATLESFAARVRPAPLRVIVLDDGGRVAPWGGGPPVWPGVPWIRGLVEPAAGFCRACRELWRMVARDEESAEHAFWLEDDFSFERDVDLGELAEVLDANGRLTQMALMRGPANDEEERAGGCRALRPWAYHERDGRWLESFTNHSTTCSLMRREFMAANPWPDYPENCEGLFSHDLLRAGRSFGVWGNGEAWVEHVGARAGFGY